MKRRPPLGALPFVAFDGEGAGRAPHRYTNLTAVSEAGDVLCDLEARDLDTETCLEALSTLVYPTGEPVTLLVGFAIGYDVTMILRGLAPYELYRLSHDNPERQGPTAGWIRVRLRRADYSLRFRARQLHAIRHPRAKTRTRTSVVCADIFPFFQCRAVKAFDDWHVYADPKYAPAARRVRAALPAAAKLRRDEDALLAFMRHMKSRRAGFSSASRSLVRLYNRYETQGYADLMRLVWTACDEAGLRLDALHGAGSVAKSLFRRLDVLRCLPPTDSVFR